MESPCKRQFYEQHPLILQRSATLMFQSGVCCSGCNQAIEDQGYGCFTCWDLFHKSCTELPQEIHHPFHSQHPVVLVSNAPNGYLSFSCISCEEFSGGFAYHCSICGFYMDVLCAMDEHSMVKYEDEDHLLCLFHKDCSFRLCQVCDLSITAGPFFSSVTPKSRYSCHLHCAPLPFPDTITHKSHWHPLTLTKSLAQDQHEHEFYCDICEKERDPNHPVYYCKECENKGDFVAHMVCALSEELLSMASNASVRTPIEKLDGEIAELRAEELAIKGKLKVLELKMEEATKALKEAEAKRKAIDSNFHYDEEILKLAAMLKLANCF